MKIEEAQPERSRPLIGTSIYSRLVHPLLPGRDGAVSVDGIDAAIRGFGVATVTVMSLAGYGRAGASLFGELYDPTVVAAALVLYNLLVILVTGVPWRRPPGFFLFVIDWAVVTIAVVLTGGFFSPFILLYYSLAIGAALRVGLSRSMLLVAACGLVYVALSISSPGPVSAVQLPVLVVEITSLVMVVVTAVGMKRAVEVEARKVELEEQSAEQFRLLNNLINTVLSASPDPEQMMRSVATISSQALQADSGLAVLFDGPIPRQSPTYALNTDNLLLVSDQDPNPPHLSDCEHRLLEQVVRTQRPVTVQDAQQGAVHYTDTRYPGLETGGRSVRALACVPFILGGEVIGVLFVGRHTLHPFTEAQINLLTAIGQQMAVAVRMSRLYDMEREKAIRSEEREQLERDLLSMVSHELRTPLTSIKTCVGALAGNHAVLDTLTQDSPQTRLLNNIGRSTDRLITLVNELLDMGRLRAGRVTLNLQQLNMGEVILDIAPQVMPLLDARQQTLSIDLPQTTSSRWDRLTVLADRRRIEQVLLNLLSNANKYGPIQGNITLGATPKDGQVRIFVRDEGPGIAPHEQNRIFEKFYQGAQATVARPDSAGLGLAIARSIVELHGGCIDVYSRVGRGSTFYFTLAQVEEPTTDDGRRTTDNPASVVRRP